jgi:tetratricopeptide (TPR) repeat protein
MSEDDEPDFDEAWYVANNPDIAAAIADGRLARAIDHYREHGRSESRLPRPPANLNPSSLNPDDLNPGDDFQRWLATRSQLGMLDQLGIVRGTDKSSLGHDYLNTYERLFSSFRDLPIVVLEIGVAGGASLRLWEDYFPRAWIVGIDIRDECRQYAGGRRIVEIASQADRATLHAIGARYQPAIIIDDGSHRADHIINSFESLFPALQNGGLYIVEDLMMHAGARAPVYVDATTPVPAQYFCALATQISCNDPTVSFDEAIAAATQSVEFHYGLAVIRKHPERRAEPLEHRRALVQENNSDEAWRWFSSFILRHNGATDEAVACAARAMELAPGVADNHLALAEAMAAAGRTGEALAAARRAVEISAGHPLIVSAVDALTARIKPI